MWSSKHYCSSDSLKGSQYKRNTFLKINWNHLVHSTTLVTAVKYIALVVWMLISKMLVSKESTCSIKKWSWSKEGFLSITRSKMVYFIANQKLYDMHLKVIFLIFPFFEFERFLKISLLIFLSESFQETYLISAQCMLVKL